MRKLSGPEVTIQEVSSRNSCLYAERRREVEEKVETRVLCTPRARTVPSSVRSWYIMSKLDCRN